MSRSIAATRVKVRALEAQVNRFRGVDRTEEEHHEEDDDRADVTTLLIAAHEAASTLEGDLETLRERLTPVMDPISPRGEEEGDDDNSIAPAIAKLAQLVKRIEDASRAIRFLTRNARI